MPSLAATPRDSVSVTNQSVPVLRRAIAKGLLTVCGLAVLLAALPGTLHANEKPLSSSADKPESVVLVTLGDSITKAVRPGVKPDETFSAIIERRLNEQGIPTTVFNLGIGGERTDQGLKRLSKVIECRPQFVTVMYGANDSYVDPGKTESRLSPVEFRRNLQAIVAGLLHEGIEPILMTGPRCAPNTRPNGLGENPNGRLATFMEVCREVAAENSLPLIDHFQHWTDAEEKGANLAEWTTDGLHPNPHGQRVVAELMLPVLLAKVQPNISPLAYDIKLDTVLKHDDAEFLWFHPRPTALPGMGKDGKPAVLMTLQKHLGASDHYSGSSTMWTYDMGAHWSEPVAPPELDWVRDGSGVDIAVADVTPVWHPATGKVIAVGAQVRYSSAGKQLEDQPRAHQTAYAVYDPQTKSWTKWRRLEMPEGEEFNFARSACAQSVVEPDGTVLLPFYVAKSAKVPFATTVVRCKFDGDQLTYHENGNVLALNVARGLYEPSLIEFQGKYYLTIRNDLKGYVTVSSDGLHYRPVKPWMFDDGGDLGSYNTQQHWVKSPEGLFLVYTRRGADNGHIMRHRAPLFIAQVDTSRLLVVRETERILVPERGATLGNFGAASITDNESWVTVSEGMFGKESRKRGAEGATFVARIIWGQPTETSRLPRTRAKLQSGEPVRIVCFGDSVTGVYYHTGGRRAYTDMLGIALQKAVPNADLTMINAGISGNTTAAGLKRIDRDVIAQKPTLVTVMFGLNDLANANITKDKYRENLRTIVKKCRAVDAEVLLCTPNTVITTPGRPIEGLKEYCDIVREVGRELNVPVSDCFDGLEAMRAQDARGWRLLMSDAIHPNMAGHKRLAEMMAASITGKDVSLADVPPPTPAIPHTLSLVRAGKPIKVLAMPPLDTWVGPALKAAGFDGPVEVVSWATGDKTLAEIESDAKARVRALKPDLVLLAVPRTAAADSDESRIHSYSWIMNSSLSFGLQEWDCVVVHPAVVSPPTDDAAATDADLDTLVRTLVHAQDLTLIDRPTGNTVDGEELFSRWLDGQLK